MKEFKTTLILCLLVVLVYLGLYTDLGYLTIGAAIIVETYVWFFIIMMNLNLIFKYNDEMMASLKADELRYTYNYHNYFIRIIIMLLLFEAEYYLTGALFAWSSLMLFLMIAKTVADRKYENRK